MIANYTTKVDAHKSTAEILAILSMHRAEQILITYSGSREPEAISFQIKGLSFRLPADAKAVQRILERDGAPPRYRTVDHARNVAWRVVRDWLRAQVALIDSGIVSMDEIMLPYALGKENKTVIERYREGKILLVSPDEKYGQASHIS